MTSKESLDYMYGVAICGSGLGETADKVRECYNDIVDELDILKEYRKIMGTPIQEIMKRLKVLELLKRYYRIGETIDEDFLVLKKPIPIEDADKIEEWLKNDK